MAKHNHTGQIGEELATSFLIEKGFAILAKNYRYKRAEIDIIAQKPGLLLFVEVKTRTSNYHGFPEEAITQKKVDLFLLAAEEFIHQLSWQHDIRFDVIAVSGGNHVPFQIHHIEDAFH
ncbi:YraN family protein [Adhaeribacter pallidiroseus]|nr:YraN family protein [Adhaeribacter pallidiroseus]